MSKHSRRTPTPLRKSATSMDCNALVTRIWLKTLACVKRATPAVLPRSAVESKVGSEFAKRVDRTLMGKRLNSLKFVGFLITFSHTEVFLAPRTR